MGNYSLEKIPEIKGRISLYYLIVNGKNLYSEFKRQIIKEGRYSGELNTIQTRLIQYAELKLLPNTKFKNITPKNDVNQEYEVKTSNLRVLMFKDSHNDSVVVYGFKKSKKQNQEISRFRRIKKEYFESKKIRE